MKEQVFETSQKIIKTNNERKLDLPRILKSL